MTEINTISDIIYDIKESITDAQYKTIMECLMELNKKTDDIETEITRDFLEQFFYHSHKNNRMYHHNYNHKENSLWVSFEYQSHRFSINSQFLYSKIYNSFDKSITVSYAIILKIMPKYSVIQIDNYHKKISNKTLAKLKYFPYIEII